MYGIIHTFLVPDFQVCHILTVFGALAWTAVMKVMVTYGYLGESVPNFLIVLSMLWGTFPIWSQLLMHDGWKMLSDEEQVTQKLLQRNGMHLYKSGDTPFVMGILWNEIWPDGKVRLFRRCLKVHTPWIPNN